MNVLKELELASLKLDDVSTHNFQKEHLLTSRIALEINNLFFDGVNNKDKGSLNQSIKIMQEETKRLSSICKHIQLKRKWNSTFTRDSAKQLLLKYIPEKDISDVLLNCFPEKISKPTPMDKELKGGIHLKTRSGRADVLPRREIKAEMKRYQ